MLKGIGLIAILGMALPCTAQINVADFESYCNPARDFESRHHLDSFDIFFDANWRERADATGAIYHTKVVKINDSTWACKDYQLPSYRLNRDGTYKDAGLKQATGTFVLYDFKGEKDIIGNYVNNSLSGWLVTNWGNTYPDSTFIHEGRPLGYSVSRNSKGKITSELNIDSSGAGTYKRYYSSGSTKLEAVFSEGYEKTGTWIAYHNNGQISFKGTYLKGILIGTDCFDSLGKREEECGEMTMPEFKGGKIALMYYLQANLKYPKQRSKLGTGVGGQVVAQFLVNEAGQIESVKITKSLGADYDAEVLRVVKSMPPWHPGKRFNIGERVYFQLPVTFRLD
jgi:TonB family protein